MCVQTGEGSDVVVKINPNMLKYEQSFVTKKYSSTTSGRTEENNCMDCSQCNNEVLSKILCAHEIVNCFHCRLILQLRGKSHYKLGTLVRE